jgi:SAM-dependent methyltransferase
MHLSTAHEEWERRWNDERERALWGTAEPAVVRVVPWLRGRGARRVLDVGSGIGRHALLFAQEGFDVDAIDASPTGVETLQQSAAALGVPVRARVGPFTPLPYGDASFDHVLAWNVVYHGDGDVVRSAFAECRRVLGPGGGFQLTMLSKRNRGYGRGREIRPDTFVRDNEGDLGDKAHPHFYVDAVDLTRMLRDAGFGVLGLEDVDQDGAGAFHWSVLAEAS